MATVPRRGDVGSKRMRRVLAVVLAFLICIPRVSLAVEISLVYDPRADEACASKKGEEIEPRWDSELRELLPEFKALWAAKSPGMIGAASSLTRHELTSLPGTVRLTLCDIPSQAMDEPIVNMRYALKSFTPAPVPLRYKLDTAFHEVLHTQLRRFYGLTSGLLRRHLLESSCVRNHLHLLALQKAVLVSLHERDALLQVIHYDSQLPSACYKRAWRIINETQDTYKAYVAELAKAG